MNTIIEACKACDESTRHFQSAVPEASA